MYFKTPSRGHRSVYLKADECVPSLNVKMYIKTEAEEEIRSYFRGVAVDIIH